MLLPGPNGRFSLYQIKIKMIQLIAKDITNGSMVAIMEPRPDFLSYFSAVMMINGMNGSRGETALVTESAIRKAACVKAGVKPSFMNMGTKIGAISAHFADALPIMKLISIVIQIKPTIRGAPVRLLPLRNSDPLRISITLNWIGQTL